MGESNIGKTIWKWIGHILQARELWIIFVGSSSATSTVLWARSYGVDLLIVVLLAVAAFAAGALITRYLYPRLPYWIWPPATTVELYGGAALTLAVEHKGLPVKVRVQIKFMEFGEFLESRPEPCEVHLQTKAFGGSYRQVDLGDEFDFAKATIATLQVLEKGAAQFSVEIPGLGPTSCVVQTGEPVLINLLVMLSVHTPLGLTQTEEWRKIEVRPDRIRVWERQKTPTPQAEGAEA